jgi:hypothetical protein
VAEGNGFKNRQGLPSFAATEVPVGSNPTTSATQPHLNFAL